MKKFVKPENLEVIEDGKTKEKEFASHFDNVIFSDRPTDIAEHWDVMIDGIKYDVKSVKKTNEFYHFLEIKNVFGERGWVYGQADFFAFETNDFWVIVGKEKVQDFIKTRISKKWVTNPDESLYCLYRRPDLLDCMTMVKTFDLMLIADRILTKTIGIIEHEIGDSIIPEKRAQQRLNTLFNEKK